MWLLRKAQWFVLPGLYFEVLFENVGLVLMFDLSSYNTSLSSGCPHLISKT